MGLRRIRTIAGNGPWSETDDGLWCPTCGELVALRFRMSAQEFSAPATCKSCGFPEFEDGHGHFTDDA
jgi:transcription elongation factor Elf1